MDDVDVTGDCGVNKTMATLKISWPKNESFYQLAMDFKQVVTATASSNMTNWMVSMITFNATLENNPDFKNASGERFYFLWMSSQILLVDNKMIATLLKSTITYKRLISWIFL